MSLLKAVMTLVLVEMSAVSSGRLRTALTTTSTIQPRRSATASRTSPGQSMATREREGVRRTGLQVDDERVLLGAVLEGGKARVHRGDLGNPPGSANGAGG